MKYLTLLSVVCAALLLGGCASTNKGKQQKTEFAAESKQCENIAIGSSLTSEWCSAINEKLDDCGCGPLAEDNKTVFKRLANKNLTSTDLKDWYSAFNGTLSLLEVERYAISSGIPVAEVWQWHDLGKTFAETVDLYKLGEPINKVELMLDLGLTARQMKLWMASGVKFAFWPLWMNAGYDHEQAGFKTKIFKLHSSDAILKHIKDESFISIDDSVREGEWICSRSNEIGQVTSFTNNNVHLIKRYSVFSGNGEKLPPLSLFDSESEISSAKFVRSIVRISDAISNWAKCPPQIKNYF